MCLCDFCGMFYLSYTPLPLVTFKPTLPSLIILTLASTYESDFQSSITQKSAVKIGVTSIDFQ